MYVQRPRSRSDEYIASQLSHGPPLLRTWLGTWTVNVQRRIFLLRLLSLMEPDPCHPWNEYQSCTGAAKVEHKNRLHGCM
jgi:hypothetical protein